MYYDDIDINKVKNNILKQEIKATTSLINKIKTKK